MINWEGIYNVYRVVKQFKHWVGKIWHRIHLLTPRMQKIMNTLLFIFVPILSFWLLESFQQVPWEIPIQTHLLNLVFYYLLAAVVYLISKRLSWTSYILLSFGFGLGLINYQTMFFTSEPILAGRLLSFKTALGVAGDYRFVMNKNVLTSVIFFVVCLFFASFATARFQQIKRRKKALTYAASALALVIMFFTTNFFEVQFNIATSRLYAKEAAMQNGFVINFLRSAKVFRSVKPPVVEEESDVTTDILLETLATEAEVVPEVTDVSKGVPVAQEGQFLNRKSFDLNLENLEGAKGLFATPDYSAKGYMMDTLRNSYLVNRPGKLKLEADEKADIIVIMNESFSDLRVLADFGTNHEILPFLSSLETNVRKGTLHSSVVGGGTANAEFEFLTGASMAFLNEGSIPFQEFFENSEDFPSIVSLLREQGYHTIGMHPYWEASYQRNRVYPALGFMESKFEDDFVHQDKLRNFISDRALYQEILMDLEKPKDSAHTFIFSVSMQNHGDYNKVLDDNFPADVILTESNGVELRDGVTGEFSDAFINRELNEAFNGYSTEQQIAFVESTEEYLALVRESDRALGNFLAALKERNKPTMVVFFGDHQPAERAVQAISHEEMDPHARRQVPYFIWTNYEMEEQFADNSAMPYLAAEALPLAGVEKNLWLHFLSRVQQEIPIITNGYYMDQAGALVEFIMGRNEANILKRYEFLQYNYLFGEDASRECLFQWETVNDGNCISGLCGNHAD